MSASGERCSRKTSPDPEYRPTGCSWYNYAACHAGRSLHVEAGDVQRWRRSSPGWTDAPAVFVSAEDGKSHGWGVRVAQVRRPSTSHLVVGRAGDGDAGRLALNIFDVSRPMVSVNRR
jgi:hypothetical protein